MSLFDINKDVRWYCLLTMILCYIYNKLKLIPFSAILRKPIFIERMYIDVSRVMLIDMIFLGRNYEGLELLIRHVHIHFERYNGN